MKPTYEQPEAQSSKLADAVMTCVSKVEELQAQVKQLAAENADAKKIIGECREFFIAGVMNRIRPTNEGYLHMICDTFADETPATDAYLSHLRNEARAEGVDMFAKTMHADITEEDAIKFAQQLREGKNSAQRPAVTPLPVERDECGMWTHPAYSALFGNRDGISEDEFVEWSNANGIVSSLCYLDGDDEHLSVREEYFEKGKLEAIADWKPSAPAGSGWFLGSIHDTEEGPVAVWFRAKDLEVPS